MTDYNDVGISRQLDWPRIRHLFRLCRIRRPNPRLGAAGTVRADAGRAVLFGIYRLFAEGAPRYAHAYRAGILGYVIFGGCGFHLPVCAMAFLARHGLEESLLLKYAAYFALPGFALF